MTMIIFVLHDPSTKTFSDTYNETTYQHSSSDASLRVLPIFAQRRFQRPSHLVDDLTQRRHNRRVLTVLQVARLEMFHSLFLKLFWRRCARRFRFGAHGFDGGFGFGGEVFVPAWGVFVAVFLCAGEVAVFFAFECLVNRGELVIWLDGMASVPLGCYRALC
jgi:hypothetical protein